MSTLYHADQRRPQRQFDTTRLPDRLGQVKVHNAFTPDDPPFLAARDMVWREPPAPHWKSSDWAWDALASNYPTRGAS
jgi:hypothetical protein